MMRTIITALLVLSSVAIAEIPPLDSDTRLIVESAADDRDYAGAAFTALVDHARTWATPWNSTPIRLGVDPATLNADPAAHRGTLWLVSGTVDRVVALPPPHDDVRELAVRLDSGEAVLVYQPIPDSGSDEVVRTGVSLEMPARYFKRMQVRADDGVVRTYASFVGSLPALQAAPATQIRAGLMILALVAAGVAFIMLFMLSRRAGRRSHNWRPAIGVDDLEAPAVALPEDPADALARLSQQSSSQTTDGDVR